MQKGLGTDQGKNRSGVNYFSNCPFAGPSKDVVRPRTSDDIDCQETCPSRALLQDLSDGRYAGLSESLSLGTKSILFLFG